MKRLLNSALIFVLVAGAASATASIRFTLHDVQFVDGTTAAGSFTTDNARTAITEFGFQTQDGMFYLSGDPNNGGGAPVMGQIYSAATDTAQINGTEVAFFVDIPGNTFTRNLFLELGQPLAAGVTYTLGGYENIFFGGRNIASGTLVSQRASDVPEPVSWAMMVSGFGLIGATTRKCRKIAVAFG